jgi:hypothetical protein
MSPELRGSKQFIVHKTAELRDSKQFVVHKTARMPIRARIKANTASTTTIQ